MVNLGIKYDKELHQQFTKNSILQNRLEKDVDFVGTQAVRIHTVNTMPMNDYKREGANRYGDPQEIGDSVQELIMTQDKSFTGTVDKGNSKDQSINKAGKVLRIQLDEVLVPMKDTYGFKVLSNKAGAIVGASAAIAESNVLARLSAGRTALNNALAPLAGQTLFIKAIVFNALIETKQFIGVEKMGEAALLKGQVGKLFGVPVVEVPDAYFPASVNFLWLHRSAACSPCKIADTKLHEDPPGLSGNQIEGRFYWDTFVFGARANGIYVDVTTGAGVSVLAAPAIAAATGIITAAAGAAAYYTVDGSDPRYSISAKEGTASGATSGMMVRAYQAKPNDALVFSSPVASVTIT